MTIGLENVSKQFGNNVVLKNVSLTLRPSEIVILRGPSGGGKSTLLRIMALLDPADKGIFKFENNITLNLRDSKKIKEVRERIYPKISVVFQQLHLWPTLSVKENILLPIKEFLNERYDTFEKLVKYFNIDKILNLYPNEISLGQKQRVAIVRNVLTNARYFLWDEVTSALDEENVKKTIKLIHEYKYDQDKAFLIITHDYEMYSNIDYSRMYKIEEGKIKLIDRREHYD